MLGGELPYKKDLGWWESSRGLPYQNDGGARRKIWKERLGTPVLWAGLKFFSPLRGTNSKTTHYLQPYFFLLNTLKGTAKAPAVDLLMLNTLRGTKNAF